MNTGRINRLIGQIQLINQHKAYCHNDPLLAESLEDLLTDLELQYGSYLLDKLFDVYDDCFDDNEMASLEDYLNGTGVEVESDEFDVPHSRISIKPFPLRIEVEGVEKKFKKVMWQAA